MMKNERNIMMFPYENPKYSNTLLINDSILKKAIERFKQQQEDGSFPGGQMVVRRHGKVVLSESKRLDEAQRNQGFKI